MLSTEIDRVKHNTSEIFGKMRVLDVSGGQPDDIVFTMPLSRQDGASNHSAADQHVVAFCKINLTWLQWLNAIKAVVAGGGFLLFLGFVGALVANFSIRLNEQGKAFQMVAKAMNNAPVAYARLDEHDRFVDMNKAFVKMLGFNSVEECRGTISKFRELLANEKSVKIYDTIEKARPVDGYMLELRKTDRSEVPVRIFGGEVPVPPDKEDASPPTFGIIIPTREGSN